MTLFLDQPVLPMTKNPEGKHNRARRIGYRDHTHDGIRRGRSACIRNLRHGGLSKAAFGKPK